MVRKSQPARLVISPVCFWAREERGEKGSVRQYEAPQAFSGGGGRGGGRCGTEACARGGKVSTDDFEQSRAGIERRDIHP